MCDLENCDETRRTFISRAGLALGLVIPIGLVPKRQISGETQAQPQTRVLDRPGFDHEVAKIRIHEGLEMDSYLARPHREGRFPAALVIPGNLISEEYIPNTCAALALAGFVGLAPNIYHPVPSGTSPRDGETVSRAMTNHPEADQLRDMDAALDFLSTLTFFSGRTAILGFCHGGRLALLMANRRRELDAVVAFHPGPVRPEELNRIAAPVQIHHGTADTSVKYAESEALHASLNRLHVQNELWSYEGAEHGFLAYTRPFYQAENAQLAWSRCVDFLHMHCGEGRTSP
jgi:carboxymethylenebutenolidase